MDRRRQQRSWQEVLDTGSKLRVMLKGALVTPTLNSLGDANFQPTSVDVYVCLTNDDSADEFPPQLVTDEVIKVAVYDPSLPNVAAPTGKTGLYGHVELIDGILELTWVGC